MLVLHIFHDITVGDNCRTAGCVGQQDGFSCTVGWDPVTGLGTPRYTALRTYIRSLAGKVMNKEESQTQQQYLPEPKKQLQEQARLGMKRVPPSKLKSLGGNVLNRMNGEPKAATTVKGRMQK